MELLSTPETQKILVIPFSFCFVLPCWGVCKRISPIGERAVADTLVLHESPQSLWRQKSLPIAVNPSWRVVSKWTASYYTTETFERRSKPCRSLWNAASQTLQGCAAQSDLNISETWVYSCLKSKEHICRDRVLFVNRQQHGICLISWCKQSRRCLEPENSHNVYQLCAESHCHCVIGHALIKIYTPYED